MLKCQFNILQLLSFIFINNYYLDINVTTPLFAGNGFLQFHDIAFNTTNSTVSFSLQTSYVSPSPALVIALTDIVANNPVLIVESLGSGLRLSLGDVTLSSLG